MKPSPREAAGGVTGRPEASELAERLVEALRPLVAELVDEELERRASDAPAVEWLTVDEYADRHKTTRAAVLKRLERGRIAGATKDGGRAWLIPEPATLPADKWGSHRANGRAPDTRR